MSTFRGVVQEFPDIRIDFFRSIPDLRPPLACFLSHVHSDHLAGLESLKSPFVYCSAATKEILLRLERYPHRMNFAKGILESRKLTYKHLKNLLKPIHLETPTRIELSPGKEIQVTLFDANHCTGAVMFLIEDAAHAILYTGDIRSEPWFVNRLSRSPFLVEYTSGIRVLDCVYLDTSNAGNYAEFPAKREGLVELIEKVKKYPEDTTFHFAAWTYGYEEVWMALSKALKSPIHVDTYKMRIYQSLRGSTTIGGDSFGPALSHEGSVLAGYKFGNNEHPGILTRDQKVRLHSCEKGTDCSKIHEGNVVWIQPIVCRRGAKEVVEVGIGGGGEDLTQKPELELDPNSIAQLLHMIGKVKHSVVDDVQGKLLKGLHSSLESLSLADMGMDRGEDGYSLDELARVLIRSVTQKSPESDGSASTGPSTGSLPKTITFPYSRHSSHSELCDLVKTFQPADIYPCTVDEDSWHEGISIKALFGEFCSNSIFRHDAEMRALHDGLRYSQQGEDEDEDMVETQKSRVSEATSEDASMPPPSSIPPYQEVTKLTSFAGTSSPEARADNHTTERGDSDTPTHDIPELDLTATPSSQIQNRRRKAVEDFVATETKRPRLSSVSEADDGESTRSLTTDTEEEAKPLLTFYDSREFVHRCGKCGWELWMPTGACEGCGAGEDAYEEHTNPAMKVTPETAEMNSQIGTPMNLTYNLREIGTDNEPNPAILAHLRENYLDYASSAYSEEYSEDEDEYETKITEDGREIRISANGYEINDSGFEMNGMIDDAPIDSDEEEEENENDEEEGVDVYWKTKYEAMAKAYKNLQRQYRSLLEHHHTIPYPSEDSLDVVDAEGYETDELRMIDVQVHDPQLTEIILPEPISPLNPNVDDADDSQMSEMSENSEELRREAEEIANENLVSPSGRGYQDLGLMSTGNNHREASLEL